MSTITLAQICNAVESELGAATTLERSESYDELTEGVSDTPMLQVYPDSCALVSTGSGTDKLTLGGDPPHRQQTITIIADYFAHHRANIGEDMAHLVDGVDAITLTLEAQNTCPPFGLAGIRTFQWRWDRVVFDYGGAKYMGARFTIVLQVF